MTKRELASKIESRNNLLREYNNLSKKSVSSASISSGGGSKSYTNRTLEEIRKQIEALDAEIAAYKRALLGRDTLNLEYPRYC